VNGVYSFLAGILSFFSPCILPLLPSYFVYIGDLTLDQSSQFSSREKRVIIYHTLSFILGFSFVFVSFGLAGSIIGKLLIRFRMYLIILGGLVIILFGLSTLGLLKVSMFLKHFSMDLKVKSPGILGSFLVGTTFALGWSPCVGPALSSVLLLTLTAESTKESIILLALYCSGLAIPFLISAFAVDKILRSFSRIGLFAKYAKFTLGLLLIALGLILILNSYYPVIQGLLKVQPFS
jgi:cytochrome c-type biogenesis protein